MTEAEAQTKLQAIEDQLLALDAGVNFSTHGGGAGMSIDVAATRSSLLQMLRMLRRRLWAIQGGKAAEPAAVGVDIERETSNRDEV